MAEEEEKRRKRRRRRRARGDRRERERKLEKTQRFRLGIFKFSYIFTLLAVSPPCPIIKKRKGKDTRAAIKRKKKNFVLLIIFIQ